MNMRLRNSRIGFCTTPPQLPIINCISSRQAHEQASGMSPLLTPVFGFRPGAKNHILVYIHTHGIYICIYILGIFIPHTDS